MKMLNKYHYDTKYLYWEQVTTDREWVRII